MDTRAAEANTVAKLCDAAKKKKHALLKST